MAYVGIGCGALLVIGAIGTGIVVMRGIGYVRQIVEDPTIGLATIIVQTNPDLELVKSEGDSGVLQVKVKSTGEIITLDRSQIESGNFSYTKVNADGTKEIVNIDLSGAADGDISITDGEGGTLFESGEAVSDDIPEWVPALPGANDVKGSFNMSVGGKQTGSFSMKTDSTSQEIVDSYKPILEDSGFVVTTRGITQDGSATQMVLTAKDQRNNQMINLFISPTDTGSTIQATYTIEE